MERENNPSSCALRCTGPRRSSASAAAIHRADPSPVLGGDVSSNCEIASMVCVTVRIVWRPDIVLTSAVAGVGAVAGADVAEVYRGERDGTLTGH